MKKLLFTLPILVILLLMPYTAFAQGMMGSWKDSSSSRTTFNQATIQQQQAEEQEGKKLLNELKSNIITCQKLTPDNFEKIGEYEMGLAIGNTSRHIQMNDMMQSMMGQNGEEQMHIAWGERASNCQSNTRGFSNNFGFMPMMGGGENHMMGYGGWGNMMGWNGFGLLGWLSMLLFWVLLILSVVALIRYLGGSNEQSHRSNSLEILKERYAKGEINKKEFEEMKKGLR